MSGSRKNTLVASIGFALIAIVVLGGMSWATVATVELAKKNLSEDHDRKVSLAVGRIESYIGGILNSESFRNYFDYLAFNVREPLAVYTKNEDIVDASQVLLASPIAINGPPLDWIDLYFYLHPDGHLTSPQVPDESWRWTLANSTVSSSVDQRARNTFEWLERQLPTIDFRSRMAEAFDRDELPALCESQHILTRYIKGLPLPVRNDTDGHAAELTEVTLGPISPAFWLQARQDGKEGKLAFVRECFADTDAFHQGFIADWARLKPVLQRLIADLFPQADLVALAGNQDLSVDERKTQTVNLPVRIKVDQSAVVGTSLMAWRSVRGVLITTWVAALLVLAVAGWGVRNLLLSSERRMQFAYAVTHELRTPLTTFRLYSDMLSAGLVPEGSKQEYLDTLNEESLRLSSMVEGVLEYARIENHRVRLHPTETDAESLLREIRESIEPRCRQTGVVAVTKNDVPDHQRLQTDVAVVKQICGVLINNACRHASHSENPMVIVQLAKENGRIHVNVIDSGSGIDRSDARTIFKPFRRGGKADEEARGGIGLGLALARCWAGLLGGRLELIERHHAKHGGAHFRLTIPTRSSE